MSCMLFHRTGVAILAAAKDGIPREEVLAKGLYDVLGAVPDVTIDVPQVRVALGSGHDAGDIMG